MPRLTFIRLHERLKQLNTKQPPKQPPSVKLPKGDQQEGKAKPKNAKKSKAENKKTATKT